MAPWVLPEPVIGDECLVDWEPGVSRTRRCLGPSGGSYMRALAEQPLPEPYGTVHRLLASDTLTPWRDPNFETRLADCFTRQGSEDPHLVEASLITSTQADACREQMSDKSLTILGPLMIAIWAAAPPIRREHDLRTSRLVCAPVTSCLSGARLASSA